MFLLSSGQITQAIETDFLQLMAEGDGGEGGEEDSGED